MSEYNKENLCVDTIIFSLYLELVDQVYCSVLTKIYFKLKSFCKINSFNKNRPIVKAVMFHNMVYNVHNMMIHNIIFILFEKKLIESPLILQHTILVFVIMLSKIPYHILPLYTLKIVFLILHVEDTNYLFKYRGKV